MLTRTANFEYQDDITGRVEGIACVFDQPTDLGWFTETIDRHAFDECDMSDVVLNFNHDNSILLARTLNGSLTLSVDDRGLHQSASIIDTTDGEDVMKLVKNGLVNKMSFAFTIARDGERWETINGKEHRTITKIEKLFDVSLVTFPAYSQTSASARDDEMAKAHLETLKRRREQDKKMEAILNGIKGNS